ncbi:disulfide bond formation protein B [Candidatus Parcubacteria bacterium]|nr:disulfide bond formation protein B [Candidatus Parcubacteria bacterium]
MNLLWSTLSVVAEILAIGLVAAYISPKLRQTPIAAFFRDKGLLIAFVVSLLATAGSLIYSDVLGYEPCKLCWFQRIFMYPQVLLMGMALFKKDHGMKIYGFVMSAIGAAIALFHYTGQLGLTPLPCSAVGYSASCAQKFVLEFGYITIPMMAFSAFILIAATLLLSMKREEVAPISAS